ncbi:DNA internalization-related competence protein ComEC/Rec2 [Alkalihalobacterium alkalinitrilicum]|uniref:DNA internalization-related competence protein ComEC/Rec2 n=1 Tax=Alkalihalobacterium alkalinitrilicum TaxID=427920 RepID=UPI000994E731|nr:DNA internalization-related competence protein ComEC/Rec2 [Alkalihalobacterium alkalinitrilicum]
MVGRWHLIVLAAIISIVLATNGFQGWLLFLIAYLIYYLLINRKRIRTYGVFLVLSLLIFYVSSTFIHENNKTKLFPQQTSLYGTIHTIPQINGDRLSFQLKTSNNEKLQVNYFIKSEEEQHRLKNMSVGMQCTLEGTLRKPSPPTNFYAFNYEQYLFYQRIHWNFNIETIDLRTCNESSIPKQYVLQKIRQQGIEFINHHYPQESKGIVAALIFGDRAYLNENLIEAYQRLGVIHLLAVSGLHVGLIFSALFFILIRFGVTRERTIDALLVLLPMYVVIAGGAPSVIRAAFMTVVVLVSLRMKKRLHPVDGISFVCLIYLFLSPYSLYQLGFQLSFLISFTLIMSSEIIRKRNHYFTQLLAVTVISQFVSLPIIIFHFYEFSWISLPLNLIYIPFISLVVLPTVFITYFIVITLPAVGTFTLKILDKVVVLSHDILLQLNGLSFSSILVGKFSVWLVFAFITIMLLVLYYYERKASLLRWLVLFVASTTLFLIHFGTPYFFNEGEVTVLDVGQGDSIFIELPKRDAVYLIDTGGWVSFGGEEEWRKRSQEFEVGKDILLPFLKAKGVRTIDKLILTHGHYDHIGGARALIGETNVKEVLYAYGQVDGEYERELLTEFHKKGTKITFVKEGMAWGKGGSEFYILSPQGDEEDLNDRSIVLYSILGGVSWLFTGDLEENGEERLIRQYPHLSVDILKAGHHGSRTSSTPRFLDHMQPNKVLISAGRNNRFKHPHDEVILALEERNIKIFRTDEHGAIRITFTEETIMELETKLQRKEEKGIP